MALDEILISTGVDALIKLVHERGTVELNVASTELKLPVSTVEDWAHVLEAEGVIKIKYSLTKVILEWAFMSTDDYEKTSKNVEAKKSETVKKLESLDNTLSRGIEDIGALKAQVSELDEKNKTGLLAISQDKMEAERLAHQADEVISAKRESIQLLTAELEKLGQDITLLNNVMSKSPQEGGKLNIDAKIESLKRIEEKLRAGIEASDAKFSDVQEQINSLKGTVGADNGIADLEAVKNSLEEMKFAKAELMKSQQSIASEIKSLDMQIKAAGTKISEISQKRDGAPDPQKTLERLEAMARALSKDRVEITGNARRELEAVQKQISSISQAQYQYQNMQAHLGSMRSIYQQESQEIEKFLSLLDNAHEKYTKDLAEANTSLADRQKEFEKLAERSKQIHMIMENLDELKEEGEKLSTRLKGVMKEAQVVAMSAPPGAVGSRTPAQPKGIRMPGSSSATQPSTPSELESLPPGLLQHIQLSAQEEEAFDKKREELRGLIKKMWDEYHNPNDHT